MSRIVDFIKEIPDVDFIKGCTDEQIKEAEDELKLKFPQEFIEYVKEYGCIDFFGHELTGLNIKGRLNTVVATQKEMSVNDAFPKGYFVVENIGIDANLIVSNESGEIFRLNHDFIEKLYDSLLDYLKHCTQMK